MFRKTPTLVLIYDTFPNNAAQLEYFEVTFGSNHRGLKSLFVPKLMSPQSIPAVQHYLEMCHCKNLALGWMFLGAYSIEQFINQVPKYQSCSEQSEAF